MTFGISKTCFGVHDSWHIQDLIVLACMTLGIGLESSRETKRLVAFFWNISSWLAQQEGIFSGNL